MATRSANTVAPSACRAIATGVDSRARLPPRNALPLPKKSPPNQMSPSATQSVGKSGHRRRRFSTKASA